MNNLENKIESLGVYFDGMLRLVEGCNGVRVIVPEGWVMYEKITDEYKITPVVVFDNNIKKILFIGDKNAKVLDIMDFAYEVIMNNIENENKKELFEKRVKELAAIFDTNQLLKLENLVFKFEKPKKIKKDKIDYTLEPYAVAFASANENISKNDKISEKDLVVFEDIKKLSEQKD